MILDNMMPTMNGSEALRMLRAQGYHLPIVMMSAVGNSEQFLRDGANAFLSKPFNVEELLEIVAQQLELQ